MVKITIVIPNYNGVDFLPGCLDSLKTDFQEATVPYEVLVVDNGSTDESRALLRQQYPWVKTELLNTNTGFCHAVNVGIQRSHAPFVILLNNDTRAYPGFVQALYEAIVDRNMCFSVSASMRMWDNEELLDDAGDLYCALGWARSRGKGQLAGNYNRRCRVFSACGGAAIYRRKALDRIGLFDERHFAYLEDLDMGYRAQIYGYYNLYEPAAVVVHYGSASTGSRYNERKTELASANSVYVIAKNMPIFQIVLNFPFLLLGFLIKTGFFFGKGMGITYIKGLATGLRRSLDPEGRAMHIPFRIDRLPRYVVIQLRLWKNLFFLGRG